MSTTFTASNGVELTDHGHIPVPWNHTEDQIHAARIEFYRHLEDQRLGRWRDPEEPDYVVYSRNEKRVVVVDERTGSQGTFVRSEFPGLGAGADVARRYFRRHPEPKPWHDAKPGEVWVLKLRPRSITIGESPETPFTLGKGDCFKHPDYLVTPARTDDGIIAGHRIYPEGD